MQNIKVSNLRHILRKNEDSLTLKCLQQFGIYAPLQRYRPEFSQPLPDQVNDPVVKKSTKKYFMEIPEGLVPEPEPKEETEEEALFYSHRNKSGLRERDYKSFHKQCPNYTEDELEVLRLHTYRRLFGQYGNSSKIDLKALWPSVEELKFKKEREEVEFPHTVHEMIALAKEERLREERETAERQQKIVDNMKQLDKWMKNIHSKMEQKEEEARIMLERKEKQMEEVREVLGYKISPHDPKFQEILDKKLEEDKRKAKKEKKLKKQQQELEALQKMAQQYAEVDADDESEKSQKKDKKDK